MTKNRNGLHLIDGLRVELQSDKPQKSSHGSPVLRDAFPIYSHFDKEPARGALSTVLKATEQRLSTLLEDRNRIGRDLHDSVLQSLYAVGLNLEATWRDDVQDAPHPRISRTRILEQLNRLIHDVRRMIQSIETGTIQTFDLASELATLASIYRHTGRLQIELDIQPKAIEILTTEEEQEILNIVREALSNCARHANAMHVTVSIRSRLNRIRVCVSDDGLGFETSATQHRGYGLANMTARAQKIGGALRIQSKPGRGTHLIVEFSLNPILASV